MSIEAETFKRWKPDFAKLESYGFHKDRDVWKYSIPFHDSQFLAEVTIAGAGEHTGSVLARVIDLASEEEYPQVNIRSITTGFVETIRQEYQEELVKIRNACFIQQPFLTEQANRIADQIRKQYQESLSYPFEEEDTSAVVRWPGNNKWYAVFMDIPASKLVPEKYKNMEPGDIPETQIVNLKILEEDSPKLLQRDGIYPSYHMNHKKWITIRLDDTLSDADVMKLVDRSRRLVSGGRVFIGVKQWIVPANPKYYDAVTAFDNHDDTHWKQGKGIEEGDVVFLYVGVPYSAILYRTVVTKTHIPIVRDPLDPTHCVELMEVHITDRYPHSLCTLHGVMHDYGVQNVRGPRFMPAGLAQWLEDHKN